MLITLNISLLSEKLYTEKEFHVINFAHADLIAQGYRLKFPNCNISFNADNGDFAAYTSLVEEIDSLRVDLGLMTFEKYFELHVKAPE